MASQQYKLVIVLLLQFSDSLTSGLRLKLAPTIDIISYVVYEYLCANPARLNLIFFLARVNYKNYVVYRNVSLARAH